MLLDTKIKCISLDSYRKYIAEEAMMLIGSSAEQNPAEGSFVVVKKLYINAKTKKAALITEAPTEGFACLIEALDNFVFAKPKS